jgi:hypothetical protein
MKYLIDDELGPIAVSEEQEKAYKGAKVNLVSETHKDVKAYFEKKATWSDEALVARATQELLAELVADKVAERVEKLRKKG